MKKLTWTIFILFLFGIINCSCIKQKNCEQCTNYSEGTLIVFKEPYYNETYDETYSAKFFPGIPADYNFEGIGILGSLPSKYKKKDTIIVGIGYTYDSYLTIRVPAYKIKCIEEID